MDATYRSIEDDPRFQPGDKFRRHGRAETLSGAGLFTVFALSDEAFKAVPGKVMSGDVKNANAKTVNGANLALAKAGTMVTVEDTVVLQADLLAGNGVVHVIDRVLLPPKK